MAKALKFECIFCGTPTNFKDNDNAYCIDCYVKIRDSAHTHLPVNPWPISPMPTTPNVPPLDIKPNSTPPWNIICKTGLNQIQDDRDYPIVIC